MALRPRVLLAVAGAAALAAAGVLGVTLATRQSPPHLQPLPGKPTVPIVLHTPAAAGIRAAFRSWPHGSIDAMQALGREYPRDPVVQIYLGIALAWAGYQGDAQTVFATAKRVGRDTSYEAAADDLLHPQYFHGYPVFRPIRPNALLTRGSQLQAEGRQHSAERLYQRAARRAPGDDEAQVAAAVGRFDKSDLSASFGRLGPLTKRFPRSQVVRYYLGLLLAWTGQRDPSVTQFRRALALGPKTELGRSAAEFLRRLGTVRTGPSRK